MTNKIQHFPSRLWRLLFLALPLAACTSEVTDEDLQGDASPIAFRTAEVTKAVVDDNNPMMEFSVWGWYGETSKTQVFNAQKVEFIDNAWTYSPYQYWRSGETYRFYALYPTKETLADDGCTASYSETGALSITGFDATKGHDLMTAQSDVMYGDNPQLVAFTFDHMLSRVNIRVVGEGGDIVISEATLSGIKTKGSYDSNNVSNPWTLDGTSQSFVAEEITATSIPSDLFAEDLLVQPQDVNNFVLTVTYGLADFEETKDTKKVTLPVGEISAWEPGKSYIYTLTLTNDYIFFSKPQVNAWGEGAGGIIIVD